MEVTNLGGGGGNKFKMCELYEDGAFVFNLDSVALKK